MDETFTPMPEHYPAGKQELRFAALSLVCGIATVNFILYGGFRLGFAIACCVCICSTWAYLYSRGKKGSQYSRSILLLCLIIAAGFGRSTDPDVKLIMTALLPVAINLGLCLTAEQNLRSPAGLTSLLDAGRSQFRLSFGRFSPALKGLLETFRSGSPTSRRSGSILLGIAISVPVLAVVIPLLISADAAFDGLVALLPELDMPEILYSLGYGSCLFCLLYSHGTALCHHQEEAAPPPKQKQLSELTVNTLLIALCAVYGAYLVSQLAYFSGGFAGILPEGYSAAEYARRGFFEMTRLCVINLLVMTFCAGLVQRERLVPLSTRLLCLFVGLVTLFFVASSFAKMGLYVSLYGLTRLRVLTMVVMVFLGITVSVVSVWLFVPRLPYMKVAVIAALVVGALVMWVDVDALVADYNVDAYLSGELSTIDMKHIDSLGPGAVDALQRLSGASDKEIAAQAENALRLRYNSIQEPEDFREWTYSRAKGNALLKEWAAQNYHKTRGD